MGWEPANMSIHLHDHTVRRTVKYIGYLCAAAVLLSACPARGFVSFGNGFGSKWGPGPNFGTGAVVTWGYMLDGTTADPGLQHSGTCNRPSLSLGCLSMKFRPD